MASTHFNRFSYKIMCVNQHRTLLNNNIYKPFPKELCNEIIMFPTIKSLNMLRNNNFKFQSLMDLLLMYNLLLVY